MNTVELFLYALLLLAMWRHGYSVGIGKAADRFFKSEDDS